MATLATVSPSGTGTALAPVAAAGGGDRIPCGDKNFLYVKNGSGSSITVTVDSVTACSQGSDHDLVVVVAAAAEVLIGPITSRYAATSDGLAAVSYSGVTTLTVKPVAP